MGFEEYGWGSMYTGCVAQTAYHQHDKAPPPLTTSPGPAIVDVNTHTGYQEEHTLPSVKADEDG